MWIKTPYGELINCDRITGITYDRKKDQTVAGLVGNAAVVLSMGNTIDSIGQAIERGQKYLEVQDYV